jgi:uncharacterized membrane protein required for colicin V production
MSFIIDLIIVAIVLVTVLISAKKGFVRLVVEVVGIIAVLIFATAVSTPIADYTYQNIIEPPIVSSANKIVIDSSEEKVDDVFENLPPFVKANADSFGITREKVKETIVDTSGEKTEEILLKISQDLVKPVAMTVLEAFYAVIIILLLSVVVKIIANLLNKAFSFSIAGKLNTSLGGALGAVKGLVIAVIFCKIVTFIIPLTPNGIWIFNSENLAKTFIFEFLNNIF